MGSTWLSWIPHSSLSPHMLHSDTREAIGVGQVTLTLTTCSSELSSHEIGSVCTSNPVPRLQEYSWLTLPPPRTLSSLASTVDLMQMLPGLFVFPSVPFS